MIGASTWILINKAVIRAQSRLISKLQAERDLVSACVCVCVCVCVLRCEIKWKVVIVFSPNECAFVLQERMDKIWILNKCAFVV